MMEDNRKPGNHAEYHKIFRKDSCEDEKSGKHSGNYIRVFLVQTLISVLILGAVVITQYASPRTFISMSSALDGLYKNNITLADLSDLINDRVLSNEAVAVFFNTP